ncbi:hypothetical protein BGZ94_008469 [Podila epigama]|nr:hypothetical protein BGZ94_008469 [Podila epigama]
MSPSVYKDNILSISNPTNIQTSCRPHDICTHSILPSIPKPIHPSNALAMRSFLDKAADESKSITMATPASISMTTSTSSESISAHPSLVRPPAAASFTNMGTHPARSVPSKQPQRAPTLLSLTETQPQSKATVASDAGSSDLVQHCLLFPTYATRHSRSSSKDPDGMARKIAGVTKENNQQVYDTLEARFGMFLATNTHGAQFSIQSIGLAHDTASNTSQSAEPPTPAYLTHMELAGDAGAHDPAVESLLHELQSVQDEDEENELLRDDAEDDNEADITAADQDKQNILDLRVNDPLATVVHSNALYDEYQASIQHPGTGAKSSLASHVKRALEAERASRRVSPAHDTNNQGQTHPQGIKVPPQACSRSRTRENLSDLSPVSSTEDEDESAGTPSSFTEKVSKGAAALFKGAIQKCKKPTACTVHHNAHSPSDSLKPPGFSVANTKANSYCSSVDSSTVCSERYSDGLDNKGSSWGTTPRTDSGFDDCIQNATEYEDLGRGTLPTIRVSSLPGGHFDGTLRVCHRAEGIASELRANSEDTSLLDGQDRKQARFLKLEASHPEMPESSHGLVNLIEPEGISIISDIDDTIKETNVTAGARTILRNTFLKEMREVEGMSQTYRQWWNRGAAIHYVSNSPWQLIPSLLDFFHTHMFPPGSAHLRLHDGVLKTYFITPPGENKRRCIREILTDFPGRKFILVGDSGEIDMEIYTEMAVAFPDQIFKIFIRDITTCRLKEMMGAKSSPMPSSMFSSSPSFSTSPVPSPSATPQPLPRPQLHPLSEAQAPRSRSFANLLRPKSPINSVVTNGLSGLFGRRGSTVSDMVESPMSKTYPSTSLAHDAVAGVVRQPQENCSERDIKEALFEPSEPPSRMYNANVLSITTRTTTTSTMSATTTTTTTTTCSTSTTTSTMTSSDTISPASSPSSTPRNLTSGVKVMINSLLGSTLRKPSSLSPSPSSPSSPLSRMLNKNERIPEFHGSRSGGGGGGGGGGVSPQSTMLEEKWSSKGSEFPFPTMTKENQKGGTTAVHGFKIGSSSLSSSSSPSVSCSSLPSLTGERSHEVSRFDHASSFNVTSTGGDDVFEGFEPNGPDERRAATVRRRNETWSSTDSTSSQLSVSGTTSVPMPVPVRPSMRGESNIRLVHGSTGFASATYASSSVSSLMEGGSETPSSERGRSGSIGTNSFSRSTKCPLEVWRERVEKCQRRLPVGMLTLFESASELQACEIVEEMFSRYT